MSLNSHRTSKSFDERVQIPLRNQKVAFLKSNLVFVYKIFHPQIVLKVTRCSIRSSTGRYLINFYLLISYGNFN